MSGVQDAVPGDPPAVRALTELGRGITAASEALRAIPGDDEDTAWQCAEPLDIALTDLVSLLAMVPMIRQLGDPGPEMKERLESSRAELSARRADVASYRVTLGQLTETEEQLAEASAEARRLEDRVTALERAKRSAAEIPGLRVLAAALEADIAALDVADAADAAEVGVRLATAIERLASLTEQQRDTLSQEAANMIARAETAATELAELRARTQTAASDVARHESETAELMAEHGGTLSMLTAWSKADLDLADGMREAILGAGGSLVESVRGELSGITKRLAELDAVLGQLLDAHVRAYAEARQVRSS